MDNVLSDTGNVCSVGRHLYETRVRSAHTAVGSPVDERTRAECLFVKAHVVVHSRHVDGTCTSEGGVPERRCLGRQDLANVLTGSEVFLVGGGHRRYYLLGAVDTQSSGGSAAGSGSSSCSFVVAQLRQRSALSIQEFVPIRCGKGHISHHGLIA
jgi:hypothetical protein